MAYHGRVNCYCTAVNSLNFLLSIGIPILVFTALSAVFKFIVWRCLFLFTVNTVEHGKCVCPKPYYVKLMTQISLFSSGAHLGLLLLPAYCEFEDLLLALDALPLESQGTRVTLSRQEIVDMVIPNAVQL